MEDDNFSNHRGEASHPSDFVVLYYSKYQFCSSLIDFPFVIVKSSMNFNKKYSFSRELKNIKKIETEKHDTRWYRQRSSV